MEKTRKIYAIGEQSFPSLREADALYVDKTKYVYKLVSSKSKYTIPFMGQLRSWSWLF